MEVDHLMHVFLVSCHEYKINNSKIVLNLMECLVTTVGAQFEKDFVRGVSIARSYWEGKLTEIIM